MSKTPQDFSAITRSICAHAPVVPVLIIEDARHARPLAEALVAGGLPALEVTLRTPAALEAIREMAQVEGGCVGAGTLLTHQDVIEAKKAGAQFGVSPGATDALLGACEGEELPLLPGASTATEAMKLLERGYDMQKFFPAEASGGAAAVKALSGPLPQITFCPTGGITLTNAAHYLALANVLCVGGSWIVSKDALATKNWAAVQNAAQTAFDLSQS